MSPPVSSRRKMENVQPIAPSVNNLNTHKTQRTNPTANFVSAVIILWLLALPLTSLGREIKTTELGSFRSGKRLQRDCINVRTLLRIIFPCAVTEQPIQVTMKAREKENIKLSQNVDELVLAKLLNWIFSLVNMNRWNNLSFLRMKFQRPSESANSTRPASLQILDELGRIW